MAQSPKLLNENPSALFPAKHLENRSVCLLQLAALEHSPASIVLQVWRAVTLGRIYPSSACTVSQLLDLAAGNPWYNAPSADIYSKS